MQPLLVVENVVFVISVAPTIAFRGTASNHPGVASYSVKMMLGVTLAYGAVLLLRSTAGNTILDDDGLKAFS
jgi:hypothetical protein